MTPDTLRSDALPNRLPRPEGELAALERAWAPPQGWRVLSAVNNTHVGLFYIGISLLFFVLAGVLGLMIRAQLALPGNALMSPQLKLFICWVKAGSFTPKVVGKILPVGESADFSN